MLRKQGLLSTEPSALCKIESVLHLSCRMIGGNVERLKVIIIVFDFRTIRADKAQRTEYRHERVHHLRNRVKMPIRHRSAGKRGVKRILYKRFRTFLRGQILFFCDEEVLE